MQDKYIDIYCERTGPEYWSEPVNAVTNLSFIIAAFFLARLISRQAGGGGVDLLHLIICGLIFLIGIGSWLFHTHATPWALAADVFPIIIFILLYTWLALRRFAYAPVWVCIIGVLLILSIARVVPMLTGFQGGSYLAALAALIAIGGFLHFFRSHVAGISLLWAAVLFAVSLTLRTIDLPLCGYFGLGTHFMWHVMNALVLFVVGRAMVLHGKRY